MPYFVFELRPFGQLRKVAEFDAFRAASAHAKALRGAPELAPQTRIKVMFAADERTAEDLLCQVREAGPLGDD